MDHFLLPAHPIIQNNSVPYVCTEPYDGGPFETYGERKGKEWLTIKGEQQDLLDVAIREDLKPTSTREQESLFQTWLFFGLLQTLLGSFYREGDYVYSEDGVSYVTTHLLLRHLDQALRIRDKSNFNASKEALGSAAKCLRVVTVLQRTAQPDFDWRIHLSIASVCELFSTAVTAGYQALDIAAPHVPALGGVSVHFIKEAKINMLRAGWCPSEVFAATNKFQSLQMLYLLSRIDKSELTRDHSQCTINTCHYHQINAKEYKSRHRDVGCQCNDVRVDEESVRRIIQAGHLPLLNITGPQDSVKVEVVQSTCTTSYVALSHVWADGMGNPHANSLPACQLAHLGRLALTLHAKIAEYGYEKPTSQKQSVPVKLLSSFASLFRKRQSSVADIAVAEPEAEPEPMLIWLDTLCCPVSPIEVKRLAISRMKETYLNAAHVLVLDAGCSLVALREIESYEAIARVMTSGWTTRLWTLQEGVLAQRLWFQFRDGPEDVLNLFVRLFQEYREDFRKIKIFSDVYKEDWFSMFRSFQIDKIVPQSRGVGLDFASLDRALQSRSCSVASDEAICVSTMLNLSLKELLDPTVPATAEARMAKVWELVAKKYGGIPRGCISLDFPRLGTKGYGWAPRTLLNTSNPDFAAEQPINRAAARLPKWTTPDICTLTESGLIVKCPGFLLRPRIYQDDEGRNPWPYFERKIPETVVPFRGSDGVTYGFTLLDTDKDAALSDPSSSSSNYPLHDLIESGKCAIIRLDEHEPSRIQLWQGLVCDVQGSAVPEGGAPIPLANHKRIVIENLSLTPPWLALFSTAEEIAHRLRADPLTKQIRILEQHGKGKEDELNSALRTLEGKIEEAAKMAISHSCIDGELVKGLELIFGGKGRCGQDVEVWKALPMVIKEWFHSDFEGVVRDERQEWCLQ